MDRDYRRILHIDMDAFYASVEQRDNPALRGRPVAVGHADGRGVVAAASYEARRFGVHSAMPSRRAKELCPDIVFVEGRMSHYRAVSQEVHEIFQRYTDLIEPISIDEAFLDVTDNKPGFELGVEVAKSIKAAIRRELGLIASAGVSYNKFLAKIASDWRKPDGLCTIHPDKAIEFIDRLDVEHLWGVGPSTARRMHELGLRKAAQLRAIELDDMIRLFGKAGVTYYHFVRGRDDRPVQPHRERKSVGCETTFAHDLTERRDIEAALDRVVTELMRRMHDKRFEGLTLTLKVRLSDFTTLTRSRTLGHAWNEAAAVTAAAIELFGTLEPLHQGVRLIGLSVSHRANDRGQLDLFV